jgi:hypothetical protein
LALLDFELALTIATIEARPLHRVLERLLFVLQRGDLGGHLCPPDRQSIALSRQLDNPHVNGLQIN